MEAKISELQNKYLNITKCTRHIQPHPSKNMYLNITKLPDIYNPIPATRIATPSCSFVDIQNRVPTATPVPKHETRIAITINN